MAMFKVTYLLEASSQGWTETWYRESTSMDDAIDAGKSLVPFRMAMAGRGVSCKGIRFTDLSKARLARLVVLDNGSAPAANDWTDAPWSCLVLHTFGPTGPPRYKRVWSLRGVPDDSIKWYSGSVQKVSYSAAIETAIEAFTNRLRVGGFAFKATSRAAEEGPGHSIFAITVAENLIHLNVPGLEVGPGGTLKVKGVKAPSGKSAKLINRRWKVAKLDGNVHTLNLHADEFDGVEAAGLAGGVVYSYTPTYPVATSTDIHRPGGRKVGKAFFSLAGRQNGKKR